MEYSRETVLNDLCLGYRIFGALGWGELGDGHISARDPEKPDCFWLLRYGVAFTRATIDQLVLLNRDGETIEGTGSANAPGFRIHMPILNARRDLNAAAHTHTPWGTPFSAEVRNVEPISQESCLFFEDCALFDDEEVRIQDVEAGDRIAQCLGANNAIILRNHGLLTAGSTVAAAVARFVLLERVAETHMKVRNPKPISASAARYAKSTMFRAPKQRSLFDYLAQHLDLVDEQSVIH